MEENEPRSPGFGQDLRDRAQRQAAPSPEGRADDIDVEDVAV